MFSLIETARVQTPRDAEWRVPLRPVWRMAKRPALIGVLLLVLGLGGLAVAGPDPVDGRSLPSLKVEWASGRILTTAYGLAGLRELVGYKNLLIARTHDDGVIAFSSDEFGPPESELRQVKAEVERLLERIEQRGGGAFQDDLASLRELGPEALPLVAAEIERLGQYALAVAAELFVEAGYGAAAPALADRLRATQLQAEVDPEDATWSLVRALGKIGSSREADAVAAVLNDPRRSANERQEAMWTLVSIGAPHAQEVIDSALGRWRAQATIWWQPPDAAKILALLDSKATTPMKVSNTKHGLKEASLREAAKRSVMVPAGDGRQLIVFPDSMLGGAHDLWAAVIEADGTVGPSFLLGFSTSTDERILGCRKPRPEVRLSGETIEIRCPGQQDIRHRVALSRATRDPDWDGLSDVVEERLYTDPNRWDTDGDGIADSLDPAPNAARLDALTEEQRIKLAVFEQLNAFELSSDGLAVVATDSGLEWRGRQGVTISLPAAEVGRLFERTGHGGFKEVTIEVLDAEALAGRDDFAAKHYSELLAELDPGERLCSVTFWSGPLNARGLAVIVRKLGTGWYVRSVDMMWIS